MSLAVGYRACGPMPPPEVPLVSQAEAAKAPGKVGARAELAISARSKPRYSAAYSRESDVMLPPGHGDVAFGPFSLARFISLVVASGH